MPIEIRELNIKANASPREVLSRIVRTANGGQAGFNAAVRGVVRLSSSSEGKSTLKQITQNFTLFNEGGTPVRSTWNFKTPYPMKWKGPSNKSSSAQFNPTMFNLTSSNSWTESTAKQFVLACLGNP